MIKSQSIVYSDKLYMLKEHLWLPVYSDLEIDRPFLQKDAWYQFVRGVDSDYKWWLHGFPGCLYDGASGWLDWPCFMHAFFMHDCCHWGIRIHGIIPESQNDMIDREMELQILNSEAKIPWKHGGFIPRRVRARLLRRATNTYDDTYEPGSQHHQINEVDI